MSLNELINPLGGGIPIKCKTLAVLTAPTAGYVLTSDALGNATWQGADKIKVVKTLAAATASQSLAVTDSGSIVVVPTITTSVSLALPAVATAGGVTYQIIFPTASPGSYTFTLITNASEVKMLGTLSTGPVSAPLQIAMNAGVHQIVRSSTAGVAGEKIDISSDGSYWYITGVSSGTVPWAVT